MNKEAQAILDSILAKDLSAVTSSDLEFLRARQSYLTDEQKEKYGLVEVKTPETEQEKTEVKEPEATVEPESPEEVKTPEAPIKAPKKRSKKLNKA
jgi:hypothetical protein